MLGVVAAHSARSVLGNVFSKIARWHSWKLSHSAMAEDVMSEDVKCQIKAADLTRVHSK